VQCLFVSDLHGHPSRYEALFEMVKENQPDGVFIGGDILPGGFGVSSNIENEMNAMFFKPLQTMKKQVPSCEFYVIFGNDDPQIYEYLLQDAHKKGLLHYVHNQCVEFHDDYVIGYSCVPPTPFQLKDWERYDVSRFVDPGSVSPEVGIRSVPMDIHEIRDHTIAKDLKQLVQKSPPEHSIYLFHTPPYNTKLDRAALDGKSVDHAPLDVHVGSIAVQRFIKKYQPKITLHGHIHETVRLTNTWKQTLGKTVMLSAAHDGAELSVILFDTDQPTKATRILV